MYGWVNNFGFNMPDPIDIAVGTEIAKVRKMRGLTQTQLAVALGLTFQQLQKYESGTNRISASKLYRISRHLGVEIEDLFKFSNQPEKQDSVYKREVLELTRSWIMINAEMRKNFMEFIRALADHRPWSPTQPQILTAHTVADFLFELWAFKM